MYKNNKTFRKKPSPDKREGFFMSNYYRKTFDISGLFKLQLSNLDDQNLHSIIVYNSISEVNSVFFAFFSLF